MSHHWMSARRLFAVLIGLQAVHSVEEVAFGLYEFLPYFNWIDQVRPGGAFPAFVTANVLVVSFGVWCYLARVRPGAPSAGAYVTFWVILETLNGILHPAWSWTAGVYIPGTATAPFLLVAALLLYRARLREVNLKPAA